MRLPILAALSLALAACSRAPEPPAAPAPPSAPAPVLAGVDLNQPIRALGTEPFWSVDLTADRIAYADPEGPGAQAPRPAPRIAGTTATFSTHTAAGEPVEVVLIATECSDGMSDRTYPLVAQVEIGGRKLSGCAAPTAAIMTRGESGPVTAPQPAG